MGKYIVKSIEGVERMSHLALYIGSLGMLISGIFYINTAQEVFLLCFLMSMWFFSDTRYWDIIWHLKRNKVK